MRGAERLKNPGSAIDTQDGLLREVAHSGAEQVFESEVADVQRTRAAERIAVRCLAVAQWIPRKGILELLHAWRTVAQPGDRLDLVGEPDADPQYAQQIRDLLQQIAPDSVTVHGAVADATLAELYAQADVFALPSRFEGYGLVYAEAMSYGLPVLACAVGPLPELVGDAGILVPPADPAALCNGLQRLLRDADLRRNLAAAAQVRAAALPTWDDTAALFAQVLTDIRSIR